jgi:transposase
MGFRGAYGTVRRYLQPLRTNEAPKTRPRRLGPRQITSLIMRRPDDLDNTQTATLGRIRRLCLHLDRLVYHVRTFAAMLTQRRGRELNARTAAVEADDQPQLRSFVAGIRRDYDAVRNGLTLPHSSGAVEGHVNPILLWNQSLSIDVTLSSVFRPFALCRGAGVSGCRARQGRELVRDVPRPGLAGGR